jgi:predicted ribosome quality control (RQC) complex YloA/Tae2 family protein
MQYSAVNLHQWLTKHKALIDTSRISQIYRQGPNQVILTLHTKEGKKHLLVMIPEFILMLDEKPLAPHKDTGFGRWMRNNVKGCIIDTIEQITSERILKIQLRKGYTIYIELFNKGNLIVCDTENTIIMALQKIITRERSLVKGEKYELPESFDTFNATIKEIQEQIKAVPEDTTVSKFLASNMHLGGVVAKQICKEIEVEIDAPINTASEKLNQMQEAIMKIVKQPLDTQKIEEEFVSQQSKKTSAGFNKKIGKIENILKQQTKTLKMIEQDSVMNTAQGEFIYSNYQFFQEFVDLYNKKEDVQEAIEALKQKHGITQTITYDKPNITVEF